MAVHNQSCSWSYLNNGYLERKEYVSETLIVGEWSRMIINKASTVINSLIGGSFNTWKESSKESNNSSKDDRKLLHNVFA